MLLRQDVRFGATDALSRRIRPRQCKFEDYKAIRLESINQVDASDTKKIRFRSSKRSRSNADPTASVGPNGKQPMDSGQARGPAMISLCQTLGGVLQR